MLRFFVKPAKEVFVSTGMAVGSAIVGSTIHHMTQSPNTPTEVTIRLEIPQPNPLPEPDRSPAMGVG